MLSVSFLKADNKFLQRKIQGEKEFSRLQYSKESQRMGKWLGPREWESDWVHGLISPNTKTGCV